MPPEPTQVGVDSDHDVAPLLAGPLTFCRYSYRRIWSKVPGVDARREKAGDQPLYSRVRHELTDMVLRRALDDTSPLPPEPRLMEIFAVSRGTLRRAIDDLVREGLLSAEQGRGTFVKQEERLRRVVWERLKHVAIPDSRFDRDLREFVPDFFGSEEATRRVMSLEEWTSASRVFCAPDNSVERLRYEALSAGKNVLVPTYGLRRGFIHLNGSVLSRSDLRHAASLDGMESYGVVLGPGDLRRFGNVDLIVTGATAATSDGRHIGGGQRYLALEWAMMEQLGVVSTAVPVVALVHECQLVEEVVEADHDCLIDYIATNSRVIHVWGSTGSASNEAPRSLRRIV